jgi:hypothetical protein
MTLITAKAYLDQLARGDSLPAARIASIHADIDANNARKLHADAKTVEKASANAKTSADVDRLHALSKILASGGTAMAKAGE